MHVKWVVYSQVPALTLQSFSALMGDSGGGNACWGCRTFAQRGMVFSFRGDASTSCGSTSPPPLLPVVLQVLSAPSRSPCSSSSISYCPAGLTGFLCPVASLCRPCSVGLLLDAWSPTSSKGASFLLCIHIAAWSTGPPVSNFAVHLPISLPVTSAWITSIRGPLH